MQVIHPGVVVVAVAELTPFVRIFPVVLVIMASMPVVAAELAAP